MDQVLGIFDDQLATHRSRLVEDLKINETDSRMLATRIHDEASLFAEHHKTAIRNSSPVSIRQRMELVQAGVIFNKYCTREIFQSKYGSAFAYAHTVTLCYAGVVYLGDGLFDSVKRGGLPSTSVSRRCVKYFRENPVRAFRHAFAHGNWAIRADGSAIDYWARPGDQTSEMRKWDVSQQELVFWYTLSRAVGYALLLGVQNEADHNPS